MLAEWRGLGVRGHGDGERIGLGGAEERLESLKGNKMSMSRFESLINGVIGGFGSPSVGFG